MRILLLYDRCKGCGLCIEFCPKGIIRFSERRNLQGYKVVEIGEPEKCNHCGVCYLMCPEVVFVREE